MKKNVEYKFNILNLMKADSLYNQGLKVLMYSVKGEKLDNTAWYRGGENICYFQNNIKKKNSGYFNTLTFTLKFKRKEFTPLSKT